MAGNLVWCGQLCVIFQLTLGLYTDFLGEKSVKTNRGWGGSFFVSKTAVFWNVLVNQKEMEF